MTDTALPCPSCGAPLGGRTGCQRTFDAVLAAAWQDPARAAVHNLVVDVYSMQHPEEYGRSAKSYYQHLAGLCCGIEHPADAMLYWSIAPSFGRAPPPAKPPLLGNRGRLNISHVIPADGGTFATRAREWAASVWDAYGPQHDSARARLREARRRERGVSD